MNNAPRLDELTDTARMDLVISCANRAQVAKFTKGAAAGSYALLLDGVHVGNVKRTRTGWVAFVQDGPTLTEEIRGDLVWRVARFIAG